MGPGKEQRKLIPVCDLEAGGRAVVPKLGEMVPSEEEAEVAQRTDVRNKEALAV